MKCRCKCRPEGCRNKLPLIGPNKDGRMTGGRCRLCYHALHGMDTRGIAGGIFREKS